MGARKDFSVVLDNFGISLYHGFCPSIIKHCSGSYRFGFISNVDKKIVQK